MASLPPGWVMIAGALLLPILGRRAAWGSLLLAIASATVTWMTDYAGGSSWNVLGLDLDPVRVDATSKPFIIVFHIAAILSAIYALHVRDIKQHMAGVAYAGSAIAAAAAGDLISLFVFWELTAVTSVFLVWAGKDPAAGAAGVRYLVIQVGSGVLLLCGAIAHYVATGSVRYESFVADGGLSVAGWLVLGSLAIKAAFPLLHNWLQDSYPKASATGTVFLSAFTTKLAIYALIRGFAGFEPLIVVGCIMTLFPIIFAVIENDLRRVLAYSLNNQLGFMVVGVGIGTELAINGTVAHAFCHIIYKSLLFMSMGAVLHRVGTTKASELGGLHKSMPWTTAFCIIGAGSIAGFPLLSGFVSKSMIITAAAQEHHLWVWIVLLIASAGVMEHSGIKIPFFAFFGHDGGHRVKEAPPNMLAAMGIASAFCIGLGLAFPILYRLLPHEMTGSAAYAPYTTPHVINQLQLLIFAALAFLVLMKTGVYPEERRATIIDSDIVYRRWMPRMLGVIGSGISAVDGSIRRDTMDVVRSLERSVRSGFSDTGLMGRSWSTSTMTWLTAAMLAAFLVYYYAG